MIGAMITHPQMAAIRVFGLNLTERQHGLGQSFMWGYKALQTGSIASKNGD